MKERGIIFSTPMVRAILAGRKSMTRRIVKPQPNLTDMGCWYPGPPSLLGRAAAIRALHYANEKHLRRGLPLDFCPFGGPGDRLWLRETWKHAASGSVPGPIRYGVAYKADDSVRWNELATQVSYADGRQTGPLHLEQAQRWRPSIHMPRWASRLTLEVMGIRVERLQDISEEDAQAEGVESVSAFVGLWDTIHGAGAWNANPWVWVVSFKRVP